MFISICQSLPHFQFTKKLNNLNSKKVYLAVCRCFLVVFDRLLMVCGRLLVVCGDLRSFGGGL